MDKLSLKEVEITAEKGIPPVISIEYGKTMAKQLADMMRENERLLEVLNYFAVGEDKTIEQAMAVYDTYLVTSNKDSGNGN